MSVQAYILIQTDVGRSTEVADSVAKIAGVTQVDDVTGPYDVIVRVEGESMDAVAAIVMTHVQAVPGITRTLTCPIVNLR